MGAKTVERFETTVGHIDIPRGRCVSVVSLRPRVRPVIEGLVARFYDRDGAPVLKVSGLVTAE